MSGRAQVMGSIARALKRERLDPADRAALEERLARHQRNLVPARAQLPQAGRCRLFAEMAREAAATIAVLPGAEAAPQAIADYLRQENLPPELRIAPHPDLQALPWSAWPLLTVSEGRASGAEPVSLTRAFAGIAETGTLMLVSGPSSPTTLNFLPDTNIVLVRAEEIVGSYEEGWTFLRARFGEQMPRTVNFITGPSRSADIEQTLQLGAHGPRRLHILLIDAGAPA